MRGPRHRRARPRGSADPWSTTPSEAGRLGAAGGGRVLQSKASTLVPGTGL